MKYEYSYVPMDEVAANIDEYIIPECQQACKNFWEKNIMTFMCSNYSDVDGKRYVMITELSDENKQILERLMKEYPENYFFSSYRQCYGIKVEGTDPEILSEQLAKLTIPFRMQDIQEGKMTREEFLKNVVRLVKLCHNPEYDSFLQTHPMPKESDFPDFGEYMTAWSEHVSLTPKQIIEVLDEDKITKSFEEYLQEYGYQDLYDPQEDIVFKSEFYKNAHLRYISYKNQIKGKPCETGLSPERIEEGKESINPSDLEHNDTNIPIQE